MWQDIIKVLLFVNVVVLWYQYSHGAVILIHQYGEIICPSTSYTFYRSTFRQWDASNHSIYMILQRNIRIREEEGTSVSLLLFPNCHSSWISKLWINIVILWRTRKRKGKRKITWREKVKKNYYYGRSTVLHRDLRHARMPKLA